MFLVKDEESYPKEFPVEKVERNMRDIDDDDDEAEETLSFCEFSVNNDSSSPKYQSQNSSYKSSEAEVDDYFEFFSGELMSTGNTTLISHAPPENIIFCGKLISYKQPISENTEKMETIIIKSKNHKKKNKGGFRWKWSHFFSSHKSKTSRKNASNSTDKKRDSSKIVRGSYKSLSAQETSKKGRIRKGRDLSLHKMSFFTSSPRKSKWYLFLFGITKFRTDMELRNLKNRQSRGQSSSFSLFRLENEDGVANINGSACMTRSKGFWAVLRALSCGGYHRAAVVANASAGGIEQV